MPQATMQVPHAGGVLRNYVGGEFVLGDNTFDNINPVDGSLINHVSEASSHTVDQAVLAARAALGGEWGAMSVNTRSELMHKIADGIDARFDDFVAAEMADTGKSLWQAQNIDIPRGGGGRQFSCIC